MNEKLQDWVRRKTGDIQEVSKEISWSAQKLYGTIRQTGSEPKKAAPCSKQNPPARPAPPDPEAARRKLTEQMDREIHRTYYKDGGFRFFGCGLRRYAAVALEREQELSMAWAGAYNTNIRPMLRQMETLEQELEALRTRFACEPLPLENARLLEQMRGFARKARTDCLDQEADWRLEDYKQAVRDYVSELSEQLLDPYRPPTEE